eukprot:CAMPEP_0185255336 /NCGR_PEP_ID=MMETSP1359-20130426/4354_1 /TAXON_ID=552665 /ORGANISM="Bigelowiella longifila, Strain CCMP242" /LENGTH=437 /DNA_ID=CAMNT_0027839137 /DNA_START=241 /DNA_END=1554 /DNA_ORIENTATION=-
MNWMSCGLVFLLLALPLYSVIVVGIPFSVELVLCFDDSESSSPLPKSSSAYKSQSTWPPRFTMAKDYHVEGRRQHQISVASSSLRRKGFPELDDYDEGEEGEHAIVTSGTGKDYKQVGGMDKGADSADEHSGSQQTQYQPGSAVKGNFKTVTTDGNEPIRVTPLWTNITTPASLFKPLDSKCFLLRSGPDYFKTKKKKPSPAPLYDFKGADLFYATGSGVVMDCARNIDFSEWIPDAKDGWFEGAPRIIVSTLQFADELDSGWFGKSDGGTRIYTMLMYFMLNKEGEAAMKRDTGAAKLLKRFVKDDLDETRFKTIIKIQDKDKLGLPFVLRKSLDQLDGKPFLAGRMKDAKASRTRGERYFEFDTFVQNYTYLARKGISTCKGKLPLIKFDYGFTIEAQREEEMPENILGCAAIGPGIEHETMAQGVNWMPQSSVL